MNTQYETDVLVIGSGGAGLRAAIEADEKGVDVLIVCKSPAGRNNATVVSNGGFRAAIEGLTPEDHLEFTMRAGNYINDRRLVEFFTREGGLRVLELEGFGVETRIRHGGISVGDTPGLMGQGLTKPLVEYIRTRGVEIIENVIITKLLKHEDSVIGAVGYDVNEEQPNIFSSKAVILATGGAGAIYKRTDCPLRVTGDGYCLAYEAGARLRDMEFVQFFPLALAEKGLPPYLLGALITEKGRIINKLGEDIVAKYGITERPLVQKSRGVLSVAIMREVRAGNGFDGAVKLDATELFKSEENMQLIRIQAPHRYSLFKDDLKAAEKPFKVAPITHFCMGGIFANENGETGIPGMYVAGEAMGGVHGSNRHGGNALTEIIVFGARAGRAAAEYSKTNNRKIVEFDKNEVDRYNSLKEGEGVSPTLIMNALRELMWLKVGPVRSGEGLTHGLKEIEVLRKRVSEMTAKSERDMMRALEVPLALRNAEIIIRSALHRKESRGAHFREDFPTEDESWLKTVFVAKNDNGMIKVFTKPL